MMALKYCQWLKCKSIKSAEIKVFQRNVQMCWPTTSSLKHSSFTQRFVSSADSTRADLSSGDPPPSGTTSSRAALWLCLFYSLPSACSHIKARREPANPQPFMVRSWPAEGGGLWITHTHTHRTHPEQRKHSFCRDLLVPWDLLFCISKNLQANPQGSGRFSAFFCSRRETKVCLQRLSYLCFAERREPFTVDTWHMISNPTKTTKLAVQRWHRKQLPAVGEKKGTKSRSDCRREVEKQKGNRGGLFGQTRVHSPEEIGQGGKHWQAAARRKDQTRRGFWQDSVGQRKSFCVHFGFSLEVKVTHRRGRTSGEKSGTRLR